MQLSKYHSAFSLTICSIHTTLAAFFYPSPQTSLIEHILVDTHGAHSSGFANAITPCTNYVSGSQNFGRETAAQWLRVAFHDFVTARLGDGTGGIDASIGFETLRDEDSGSAFNDSFTFFRPYVNSKVSMADLVALSVSMSVGNCGGPQIPVRAGRVDATEGGPFGVPAPETDLNLTLEYFANAGFNQIDAIGLTACGHTLGSVHHGGFPTVVGPEAVTPNNTAGGIHFDGTVDVFDADVVNEYLDGIGNAGGPLVTSFNVSSRSDLRLYDSDNNATMIGFRDAGQEEFFDTCATLLQRMVETVPSNVVLSDVISPMAVKPINASLDFDSNNNLVFTGYIRVLTPGSLDTLTSLTITTSESSTPVTLSPENATGTNVFGVTTFFPFSTTITDPTAFTSFEVSGAGNSTDSFQVQAAAFVVPSLTSKAFSDVSTSLNFTIATLSTSATRLFRKDDSVPVVNISAPVPQMGTLGPAINFDAISPVNIGTIGNYTLWTGGVDIDAVVTGAASVEVLVGGEVVDTLLL